MSASQHPTVARTNNYLYRVEPVFLFGTFLRWDVFINNVFCCEAVYEHGQLKLRRIRGVQPNKEKVARRIADYLAVDAARHQSAHA